MQLYYFEWFGTILALLGAGMMSFNRFPVICYILWLISNFSFIYFFNITGNNGLLFMNVMALAINSFGIYQWREKEDLVNTKITLFLVVVAFLIFLLSLYNLFLFINETSIKSLEWFASSLGVSASLMLSSRHKYSFLCWFMWSVSNIVLIYVGFKNQQYGFVTLQVGFMLTNIYGSYNWFKLFLKKYNNLEIKTVNY